MNAKSDSCTTGNQIPDSFPREVFGGAVSGMQPKLLVRNVGDRYVAGQTQGERLARYEICLDLVQQLLLYCRRKKTEKPAWSIQEIVDKTHQAIRSKKWGLSEAEIQWVMAQVAQGLHEPQPEK